ncbi:MAG: hypothetical protein ACMXYF_04795, partial [Candidatus Woesearchaeota archaeon]
AQILMIYHIPKGDASTRISFNRKLFPYRVQGNSGKFDKKTIGILQKYEKPIRSCVIFDEVKITQVKNLCREFKIAAQFYKVEKIS